MRKFLFICVVLVGSCQAEDRWCTVTGLGPGDKVVYPPIALYARVFGVLVSRVQYLPNRKVLSVEPIFGPKMLSGSLEQQLLGWTVTTDAKGEEPCQSLVISEFRLTDEGNQSVVDPIGLTEPSTLRLRITSPSPPRSRAHV